MTSSSQSPQEGREWARASLAQRRMWFLDRLAPGRPVYTVPVCHDITGPLDARSLCAAISSLVDRHSVLRSRLAPVDGEPVVFTDRPGEFRTRLTDVSTRPSPLERADRLLAEQVGEPFSLADGPLLRAQVVTVGPDRHRLVITAHHAVFDGVSREIFERELTAAYAAAVAGREPELPPCPDYRDHAEWEHAWLAGPQAREQLRYWAEALDGVPRLLTLHAERPPSGDGGPEVGLVHRPIDPALLAALRALASRHRTSVFVVAAAVYLYLLGWHTGTRDPVAGTSVAGRTTQDSEHAIGLYTNTAVLRADTSGDPTFAHLVAQVRDRVLDAVDHQDLPFDRVVDELAPARDADRNPLFQHWFDLTEETEDLVLAGVSCVRVEPPVLATHFDLELRVRLDGAPRCEVVHRVAAVGGGVAERFARHYTDLLARVASTPDAPLSEWSPSGERERAELLAKSASSEVNAGVGRTLAEWFDEVADRHPDGTAVAAGETRLSYRELRRAADAVAAGLAGAGAGPEDVVAVALPRGADLVVALLGVLKAGAGYLAVDPDLPAARISEMLTGASVRHVLTDSAARGALPAGEAAVLCLDEPSARTGDPVPARPDNLLYVVFTSGSTGRPKGVAVTHRMFANLASWHLGRYRVGERDVVSQVAATSFDASGWEIWPALVAGACLDLPETAVTRSPADLVEHFAAAGTTIAFAPTPTAEHLIRMPLAGRTRLRALLTGGDAFRPRPGDDPGVDVLNHYGPTENTVVATASGPLAPPWERTIGGPISGVRCYVVDEHTRLVPDGVAGELVLGGAGVARGYVGAPADTATAFPPDPFGAEPGARLYRTGDIVRWRAGGGLDFLGRADRQVKIRGQRVEPGEVEAALLAHPAVRAAAVGVDEELGGLIACVVPEADPPSATRLRDHLSERLPGYLVPVAYSTVSALPLTANGKLDRGRLGAFERVRPEFAAPRDEREEIVACLFADVLAVPAVGVHDDFFALGGHSLAAARLVNRIGEVFDVDLPVRVVFDRRTVAELAVEVERAVFDDLAAMTPEQVAAALAARRYDH